MFSRSFSVVCKTIAAQYSIKLAFIVLGVAKNYLTSSLFAVYPVDKAANASEDSVVVGAAHFVAPADRTPQDPSSSLLTHKRTTAVSLAAALQDKSISWESTIVF